MLELKVDLKGNFSLKIKKKLFGIKLKDKMFTIQKYLDFIKALRNENELSTFRFIYVIRQGKIPVGNEDKIVDAFF